MTKPIVNIWGMQNILRIYRTCPKHIPRSWVYFQNFTLLGAGLTSKLIIWLKMWLAQSHASFKIAFYYKILNLYGPTFSGIKFREIPHTGEESLYFEVLPQSYGGAHFKEIQARFNSGPHYGIYSFNSGFLTPESRTRKIWTLVHGNRALIVIESVLRFALLPKSKHISRNGTSLTIVCSSDEFFTPSPLPTYCHQGHVNLNERTKKLSFLHEICALIPVFLISISFPFFIFCNNQNLYNFGQSCFFFVPTSFSSIQLSCDCNFVCDSSHFLMLKEL